MKNIHFLSFGLLMVNSCASTLIGLNPYARRYMPPRTIKVQTPVNQIIPCSADEIVRNVFVQCRNQGQCTGPANSLTLTLLADHENKVFEIKEGSEAAKKTFDSFNTRTTQAFIVQQSRLVVPPISETPEKEVREENDNGYRSTISTAVIAFVAGWLGHLACSTSTSSSNSSTGRNRR